MPEIKPIFSIGQKVRVINDGEVGEVISFSFDPSAGFRYTISSKEVDLEKKEIIHGVKICLENELEDAEEKKKKEPNE